MGCGTLALLGAGLGASAAGAGLQYAGQQQSKNAMNNAVGAELARQQQYSNQAHNVFNQSLNQSTPQAAQQQLGQGQQQAQSLISRAQQVPLSYSLPSFGDVNTGQQQTRQSLSNQAASQLQGYGTYGLEQYLKDLQARNQLGVINNEAGSSAQVMPYEIQAASQRGAPLEAIGGLLGSLGGLGSIYSLTNRGATAPMPQMAVSGDVYSPQYMQQGIYNAYLNSLGMGGQ